MKNKKIIVLILINFVILILPLVCFGNYSYNYANPIGHSTLTGFMSGLLVNIQSLVGWLAVIFIVIGGVLYITASGKESQITLAKNTIVSALIGFTIAIAGPSLLKEIKDLILGGATADIDNANSIADILNDFLTFTLTLISILALSALIFSGFFYLGAKGDKNKTDKAKNIAVNSIIALSVAGGSLIIINFILDLLNASL